MVTKLDRLARSLPDARSIADELTDRSVRLISLAAADAIRRRPGTDCRRSVLLGEGWRNAQFARIRLYLDAAEGIALRPPVGRRMAGAMLVGVFERFTDRSRRVLVLAQEEARLLGHSFIGTEHILLGLIHEGDGVAAKALEALEIHLEAVRREVEKTVGASGQAPAGSPPFTPRAKKVLELSLREALQLGHNYIGTEHMLLGLIREGEGVAAQVLTTLGADLARVRQQVIVLLGGQASPEGAEAVGVSPEAGRDGPRCPTCRSALDGHVGYRVLGVGPVGQPETSEVIDVMFVYCLRCGVMLAHTPAGDIGLSPGAGSQAVAFAEVEQTPVALQPERVIAEGVTGDNVRWTLRAGGDEGNYSTILRVEDDAGVISGGGMGGPKQWGSDLLNVYSGGNPDRGPRGIVVRCDPSVEHLSVFYEDGVEAEMVTCGPVDGLRFGVLLVAPEARLREVVGTDQDRAVIERCDLRGHDASWHGHRQE